jgi:hypothetical protein
VPRSTIRIGLTPEQQRTPAGRNLLRAVADEPSDRTINVHVDLLIDPDAFGDFHHYARDIAAVAESGVPVGVVGDPLAEQAAVFARVLTNIKRIQDAVRLHQQRAGVRPLVGSEGGE